MYLFALNGAVSATFTATKECKVALACSNRSSGGVLVNGVYVFYGSIANPGGSPSSYMAYFWLSVGQAITVTSESNASCVATVLLE